MRYWLLFSVIFVAIACTFSASAEGDQKVYLPHVMKYPAFRETVIVDPTPGTYPQDQSLGVWVLTEPGCIAIWPTIETPDGWGAGQTVTQNRPCSAGGWSLAYVRFLTPTDVTGLLVNVYYPNGGVETRFVEWAGSFGR